MTERLEALRSYYHVGEHPLVETGDKNATSAKITLPDHVAAPEPKVNLTDKPLTPKDLAKPAIKDALKPMTVEVFDNTLFLPWYFSEGERRPPPTTVIKKTGKRLARLFPSEDAFIDRITNQLMFVPPKYQAIVESGARKTILLPDGLLPWNLKAGGKAYFEENECPVFTCSISTDLDNAEKADMILFKDKYEPIDAKRTANQIYGFYWRESPPYAKLNATYNDVFNWTASYR